MDKVQDGFVALRDSTKPLVIGGTREELAYVSFVGGRILISPARTGSKVVFHDQSAEGFSFSVLPEVSEAPAADPTGQELRHEAVQDV